MSLNETPKSERTHIVVFGKRNSGKSSLINAITGQNLSIVSDVKGTTTDPVYKSMELLPLGPVTIIDTAGYDDEGILGELRTEKTLEVIKKTDIALLVVDASQGLSREDELFVDKFNKKRIKTIIVFNKADLTEQSAIHPKENEIYVSTKTNFNINELKEKIASVNNEYETKKKTLVADIVTRADIVILVTPIDSSAPKGRLILPQQQVIRDILEQGGISLVVQVNELKAAINALNKKPKLVITDSQAFKEVNEITPEDIDLTSFSILFARYKGVFDAASKGAQKINKLEDNDTILISEGCTHHRQCEDIGTVKLPKMIKKYTGKNLNFEFTSGGDFPADLSKYKLIIHCGGCMLTEKEVMNRYEEAKKQNIPITNYGIAISETNGILKRSLRLFEKEGS